MLNGFSRGFLNSQCQFWFWCLRSRKQSKMLWAICPRLAMTNLPSHWWWTIAAVALQWIAHQLKCNTAWIAALPMVWNVLMRTPPTWTTSFVSMQTMSHPILINQPLLHNIRRYYITYCNYCSNRPLFFLYGVCISITKVGFSCIMYDLCLIDIFLV